MDDDETMDDDGTIESRLVEFNRFGKLDKGLLREGDFYLVSQGAEPVYPFVMTLDHDAYLEMVKALSYRTKKGPREEALTAISDVVTAMLKSDENELPAPGEPLQLDLVVNAAELGALQFEAARGPDGEALLARDDATVIITRRVRGAFAQERMSWPVTPRVLFAWASPSGAGAEVPHEEHAQILRDALEPWIGPDLDAPELVPDERGVLTILEQVTLAALTETLQAAIDEERPFSHVHFLAHGYPIGRDFQKHFGMAVHDENLELQEIEPEELVEALAPIRGSSATVTLATCESGSEANTLISKRSIAHQLHESGVPVVVASQLPLTMPGSSILMERFYPAVLSGTDARLALHDARVALAGNQDVAHHDWLSVVCYATLPEGYGDYLRDLRLQRTLASLKTAQKWSDELVRRTVQDAGPYDRIEAQLRSRTADLERHVADSAASGRRGVLEEHLGLLGSAEKRLAELCWQRADLGDGADRAAETRTALDRSYGWYDRAARLNLSHHWTIVQSLSLESVLTGAIAHPGMWHAAIQAAEIDREKDGEYWALGSLAELFLLAPLAGIGDRLDDAVAALQEMARRVAALPAGHRDREFAIQTTRRQFDRYVRWWTVDAGFFPGRDDLGEQATRLIATLAI